MTCVPAIDEDVDSVVVSDPDAVWVCVLHNDSVNAVEYVVWVLGQVFGFDQRRCEELTMAAHHDGKVAADSGTFTEMAAKATALGTYQLWATVARKR
jgi:ATP-dependent Clp protease adaptor protein ClpS